MKESASFLKKLFDEKKYLEIVNGENENFLHYLTLVT